MATIDDRVLDAIIAALTAVNTALLTAVLVTQRRFDAIDATLATITTKENSIMAVGDDILAKVTEEGNAVDSIIALLNGLVQDNVIPQSTVDAIKAAIQGQEDKLNAAITANSPPPPPPPTP